MAKKLNNDFDFEQEYYAIEVMSPLADYQFAWLMNSTFGYDFRRLPNLKVYNPKKNAFEDHAFFEWVRMEQIAYYLIHPYISQDSLMPIYYFFIQSYERQESIDLLVNKLQEIPDIVSSDSIFIGALEELPARYQTTSFKNRIQSIHNILYDLENFLREKSVQEKQQRREKQCY